MRDMSHTIYPLARVAAGLRGESIQNSPDWKPLNWRAATPMRPGALDHEKHGSRQSDGSVKPYQAISYLSSPVRVNFAYKEK
ncbi:MAG: hypothetical protein ACMV1D_11845 [Macromonas sp.]